MIALLRISLAPKSREACFIVLIVTTKKLRMPHNILYFMLVRNILHLMLVHIFLLTCARFLDFSYNQIFILVDLICCGTVLFPVVW